MRYRYNPNNFFQLCVKDQIRKTLNGVTAHAFNFVQFSNTWVLNLVDHIGYPVGCKDLLSGNALEFTEVLIPKRRAIALPPLEYKYFLFAWLILTN
jgi:hypothetical protein